MEIETQDGNWLVTCGLASRGMHELAVREARPDWQDEARALLNYVHRYVVFSGNPIRPGETMNYGFWLIEFRLDDRSLLVIHEYDDMGTDFVVGAQLSMEFWRDQHRVCRLAEAAFEPPRPNSLAAVSSDLVQAGIVEGVRCDLGLRKSGWILTSRGYNGPVHSLRQEHLLHLVRSRRDLIRYLALPVGYRFASDGETSVRFDP